MSIGQDTFENFDGWEESPNFFEETLGETVVESKEENTSDKKIEEQKPTDIMDSLEEEDYSQYFETPNLDDKEVLNEEEVKSDSERVIGNKDTLKFLIDKGLINYELKEDQEISEDEASDLIEDSWDSAIEEGIAETIKELPQPVKDIIKFATQGGNVAELLSKMSSHAKTGIDKGTDMTIEANQILAITTGLREEGYDQEEIDTQISYLKDSGKLETISEKHKNRIVEKQEKERESEVKRQSEIKVQNKERARAYKVDISKKLDELEEVKGITLSKSDKSSLPSYISDATVQLEDGRIITPMQSDLFKVMGDKDSVVLLAKLLKSGFDFSSISNKAVTNQAKEIKKSIENSTKINIKSKGSSQTKPRKNLEDYLGL